jgi:hypothetical protein
MAMEIGTPMVIRMATPMLMRIETAIESITLMT